MAIINEEISSLGNNLKVFTNAEKKAKKTTVRVAAYCRVSTNLDCQKTSLENQMHCFSNYIKSHRGWKLAEVYVEKGLSGTNAQKRPEFQRMIEDAKQGKIDFIITKSISRFARNTVDLLNYVRILKTYNVNVIFEEQNLNTDGLFSEILLTIHAAFAQEESHSISENVKQGRRKRYALGIAPWSAIYGYRKGKEAGVWEVNEKEADVIKQIFDMYVAGKSLPQICEYLAKSNINGLNGGTFTPTTISSILHNEKYVGDVVMQKFYNPSLFASKKTIKNDGSVLPRYYLPDHHPCIIDREVFLDAQASMLLKDFHRGSHQYPYYGFLRCPYCGEKMIAVSLPRNSHGIGWTCGGKNTGQPERCRRTECPQFFIKTKYIDDGIKRGFETLSLPNLNSLGIEVPFKLQTIEYSFLRKYIESITFEKDDYKVYFNKMVINWKINTKTIVDLFFEKPCEFPVAFPEWIDGQYFADGVPMGRSGGSSRNIYVGRLLSIDFCNRIKIYNNPDQLICPGSPEFGTFEVPIVIAPDSTKEFGGINE